MPELLTVEHRDGNILIGLNDPSTHNAISIRVIEELHEVVVRPEGSAPANLIFWGHGDSFSSGANMDEYLRSLEAVQKNDARLFYDSERLLVEILQVLHRPNVLSVAAVHGWVVGIGVELAAAVTSLSLTRIPRSGCPRPAWDGTRGWVSHSGSFAPWGLAGRAE